MNKTNRGAAVLRLERDGHAGANPAVGMALAAGTSLAIWLTLAEAARWAMHGVW